MLNLSSKINHVVGDVRDAAKLDNAMHKFQPEYVFHLAAQALVKKSYHNNAAERAQMDNMNEPFSNIGSFFKGGSKGGSVVPQFSGASPETQNNLFKIISANEQAVENGKFDSGCQRG